MHKNFETHIIAMLTGTAPRCCGADRHMHACTLYSRSTIGTAFPGIQIHLKNTKQDLSSNLSVLSWILMLFLSILVLP